MDRRTAPTLLNSALLFPFYIHKTTRRALVSEHDHDFIELVYIYRGNGICLIGTQEHRFTSHQFVLTPEFVPHEFRCSEGRHHNQISIVIHQKMFSHASLKGFNPKSILDRLLNMRQFVIDVPAGDILNIENIIETIYLEYSFRMKGWPDVICLELLRLLLLIDRFAHRGSQSAKKLQTEDPRIFMALKRFENDYHSESGITEVVKKSGMNQRYFIRLFKKYVGCPPLNYLNRLRIEKACEFLARTVQPVIQIAADVGFVDLANFNRLFKKYLNISPTHFRLSAHKNPNLTLPTRFDFPLKVKRS